MPILHWSESQNGVQNCESSMTPANSGGRGSAGVDCETARQRQAPRMTVSKNGAYRFQRRCTLMFCEAKLQRSCAIERNDSNPGTVQRACFFYCIDYTFNDYE